MTTLSDHISTIRGLMKLYSQPQIPHSDSYLAGLITKVAGWFQARAYEKGSRQSDFHTQWFPIKLVEAKNHGYSCYPGCTVLTSQHKIPAPLNLRNRDMIKVSTLDGREMHHITPSERQSKMLDEFFQNQYMFSIINEKITVYSKSKPTVVWVSGIWIDLSAWIDLPACDMDGEYTGSTCIDPKEYKLPIDPDNVVPMYNEVLRMLQIPVTVKEDDINNANNKG